MCSYNDANSAVWNGLDIFSREKEDVFIVSAQWICVIHLWFILHIWFQRYADKSLDLYWAFVEVFVMLHHRLHLQITVMLVILKMMVIFNNMFLSFLFVVVIFKLTVCCYLSPVHRHQQNRHPLVLSPPHFPSALSSLFISLFCHGISLLFKGH